MRYRRTAFVYIQLRVPVVCTIDSVTEPKPKDVRDAIIEAKKLIGGMVSGYMNNEPERVTWVTAPILEEQPGRHDDDD
jgi:hypothetical protein